VTGLAEEAWFPVRDELRAKSFLRRDSDRYWLHPLIRDFALGHLSDVLGGHRLAATYLQAQASSAGITPDEGLALPTHWLEAADWDQAARAALLLEEELSRQGYWEPIAARLSAALGAVPATEQTAALRGHLYLALGKRLYYLARWERALDSYQQALDLYRAVGARLGEANTLLATGTLWLEQDQPEKALKTFDDALRLYSQVGDRVGQTNVYWTVGQWHAARGDVEEAIPLLEQAVAFVQEIRHPCAASWDAYLQSVRRQTEKEA
jgi:tetratricopeptide (TPR) repeat protein